MGLFGSIGRALGGAVKGIGKVAGFALKSGLVPLPFGGTAGKLVGALLHSKAPMGHTQLKLSIPPLVARGKTLRPVVKIGSTSTPTLTALRKSPVMPGGAIATRTGVASRPLTGAAPLGTISGGGTKRRRKRAGASTRRKSRRSSGRKRTRSRRLKFGSPAWRKKYLGHGRKRRKKRAA